MPAHLLLLQQLLQRFLPLQYQNIRLQCSRSRSWRVPQSCQEQQQTAVLLLLL
jgi:hypothetical protein